MRVDVSLIEVHAVAKSFNGRRALREVSFDVDAGELVAIVGPNGAGKTTLLSIVAGVQTAGAGTVEMSTNPVGAGRAMPTHLAGADRAIGWRVGWAPQSSAVYSRLTVAENLRLFARLQGVEDPEAAVQRMLEQTGLRERAHERVERLSGGNRQRVSVALALIGDPPALALDEPTSALDPGQRRRLWEFVGKLAQTGTAVLFSTHHLGEVRAHATRAIVLADGELLFDGSPAELVASSGGEDDFEGAFVAFLAERGH